MQDNIVVLSISVLTFLLCIISMVMMLRPFGGQPSAWQALLSYWERSDIRRRASQELQARLTAETAHQQALLNRNVVVVSERSLERGVMDPVPVRSEDPTTQVSLVANTNKAA